MRILVVSNLYPPNVVGGYERLAFSVAEALVAKGHEVYVLTSTYGGGSASYDGQSIVRELRILANDKNIYQPFEITEADRDGINRSNAETFRLECEKIRPDVVFCWNLYFFDRSFIEAVEQCGVPLCLFLTDNWLAAAEHPDRVGRFFSRFVHADEPFTPDVDLVQGGEQRIVRGAAIFGSGFVRDLYAACGYRFTRDWVVHNGVTIGPDVMASGPDRTLLVTPGRLRMLFAGRLVDIKGPDCCVRAMRHVREQLGDGVALDLTIVGDDQDAPYYARLMQLIAEDDSGTNISVVPPVAEAGLAELWNAHDIYLFPSLYEPFSLTLILALAAGIPTIASAIPGNEEIVFAGRTGLTFRSRDDEDLARQIVVLARDGELRDGLSRRGKALGQKFTFGRMIQQVDGILGALTREA